MLLQGPADVFPDQRGSMVPAGNQGRNDICPRGRVPKGHRKVA